MIPQSLNLAGGTQPEIFGTTVEAMTQQLQADAAKFWQAALTQDGPIEIWEVNGVRWLYNGNHSYQAAIQAGVEIPVSHIKIVDMTGTAIPTWRFDQMVWLSAAK